MLAFANSISDGRKNSIYLVGDFNSYAKEDPIKVFADAGWSDVLFTKAHGQYTYTFDGELGSLDHVIASPAAADKVTGAGVWSINSPEWSGREYWGPAAEAGIPYRSSDHDPIVVGVGSRRRARHGRHRPRDGQRLPRPYRAVRAVRRHRGAVERRQADPRAEPEHGLRGRRRHDRRLDVHVVHPEGRADDRRAERRGPRRQLGRQPRVRPGLRRSHRPCDAARAVGVPRRQRLRQGNQEPGAARVLHQDVRRRDDRVRRRGHG